MVVSQPEGLSCIFHFDVFAGQALLVLLESAFIF